MFTGLDSRELITALEEGVNHNGRVEFTAASLEEQLGVSKGMFESLIDEDDWSFIIKSHALIESSLNRSIVQFLGEPELKLFISRLDTSNPSTGKLAIAKSLGLLDAHQVTGIRIFSKIRNKIIHDVSNVNFDMNEYFLSMDKNQSYSQIWCMPVQAASC